MPLCQGSCEEEMRASSVAADGIVVGTPSTPPPKKYT